MSEDLRLSVLACTDLQPEAVATPEWPTVDGKLFVRGLSGSERDEWELFLASRREDSGEWKPGTTNIRATLIVKCCVDASGTRLFADADIPAVGAKSAAVVDRLYGAARRLSGLAVTEDDAKN